jgi:hypothetical protein
MFGEGGGRMLVTLAAGDVERFHALAGPSVRVQRLGQVGGDAIVLRIAGTEVVLPIERAREEYERGLPEALA